MLTSAWQQIGKVCPRNQRVDRQADRERKKRKRQGEEESGEGSQQLLLVDINSKNVRKPSGQNKWRIDRWQQHKVSTTEEIFAHVRLEID